MTKKDYQAIARAIHGAIEDAKANPHHVNERGGLVQYIITGIASVMEDDNRAFSRALFIEACKTGRCKGMRS